MTALDFLVGMDSTIRTPSLFSRFNLHQAPNRNPPKTASTFRHTGWMVVTECRSYSQVTGSFRSKRQSIDPFTRSHDVSSIRCNLLCPSRAADDDDLKDAAHGSYLAA